MHHDIKKTLREALAVETERIAEEFPGFTVGEMCDRATTIMSKEDLNGVIVLRPEYCKKLVCAIWQIVSPSPKKKQNNLCIHLQLNT